MKSTEAGNETDQLKEDIKFLLGFVPPWAEEVFDGYDPTMYGTGTYDGDMEVKRQVTEIRKRYIGMT